VALVFRAVLFLSPKQQCKNSRNKKPLTPVRKITNSLTLSSSNAGLLKEGVSESNAPFKQFL